ncbi:hypothetical protein ACS0TY_017388 [Phlomoides rotata]
MSGEIIQGKAIELLQKMYGETNPNFSFSSGWLEHFKARYGIKFYRRFGESGSVNIENIENALPGIQSKLDQFQMKDIYNMDETVLFYRLEVDHSLATKQLEGRKKIRRELLLLFVAMEMDPTKCHFGLLSTTTANYSRHYKIRSEENSVPELEVGELDEDIRGLSDAISNLRYRNVMDVEHPLNYSSENDAVMESPTYEEIIESVMNNNDDENDPEPDGSHVIPIVSSKEAFQTIVTLNNYLLQHKQNIPEVVNVLQKVKAEVCFGLGGKKKQQTIDSYF